MQNGSTVSSGDEKKTAGARASDVSEPPVTVSPAGDPKSEEEEIRKLKEQVAALTKQLTDKQRSYQEQTARENERKKVLEQYSKAATKWQEELDAAKRKIEQELRMVEVAVKDNKEAIERAIREVDDEIAAAVKLALYANESWIRLREQAEQRQLGFEAAQLALSNAKAKPKEVEAALKKLKALLDQAGKAESADEYPAMYFLLSEAHKVAQEISVQTAEEYDKQLQELSEAADAAKKAAEDAKEPLAAAKANVVKTAKDAETLQAARQTKILDKLKLITAAVPVGG